MHEVTRMQFAGQDAFVLVKEGEGADTKWFMHNGQNEIELTDQCQPVSAEWTLAWDPSSGRTYVKNSSTDNQRNSSQDSMSL